MTYAIDFDGPIHWYRRGWQDGTIYDEPTPGALAGLRRVMAVDAVFIHTSRDTDQVAAWLLDRGFPCRTGFDGKFWNERGPLLITNRKLPATAYLDDRGIRFLDWDQALTALGITPRLLDCGLCYEEWGEENHPHPECPRRPGEVTKPGTITREVSKYFVTLDLTGESIAESECGPLAPVELRINYSQVDGESTLDVVVGFGMLNGHCYERSYPGVLEVRRPRPTWTNPYIAAHAPAWWPLPGRTG